MILGARARERGNVVSVTVLTGARGYVGVTQWQVRQVWRAADLKPHRLKTLTLSRYPQFAEKVIDTVGLYFNPPDNALVLSVDEKT